jgi:hypothetical protein
LTRIFKVEQLKAEGKKQAESRIAVRCKPLHVPPSTRVFPLRRD